MSFHSEWAIANANRRTSKVLASSGPLSAIGAYLCPFDAPVNFLISGGVFPSDRLDLICGFLSNTMGRYPIVILHNSDADLESAVARLWQAGYQECPPEERPPLWVLNQQYQEFEPFYGLTNVQTFHAIRQMAKKLEYTVSPKLERVVRAHIEILNALNIPISLSGFYYLSQFQDMGEFYGNIMDLPCGTNVAKRIWADLCTESDGDGSQFDLFRTVIEHLAYDAAKSGWRGGRSVSELNLMAAIERQAVLTLSIPNTHSELLLNYLSEELRALSGREFILLVDDLALNDAWLLDYLLQQNPVCHLGIIADNAVEMLRSDETLFSRLTGKMQTFVILKHNTGKTAGMLSELFGRYDYTKIEESVGTSRGFFSLFPANQHSSVQYSKENRYRVMPEEIIGLMPGQAIIFDTATDEIIYYN